MTTKPVIELKNIQHNEAMSEETNCYSASLYVDGRKWGTVSNRGQGGCDDVHLDKGYTYGMFSSLEGRIKDTYEPLETHGMTLEMDLELICGDIVEKHLRLKDAKKIMRGKVVWAQDGDLWTKKLTKRVSEDMAVKLIAIKYPKATIWNTLSDEKLLVEYERVAS